MISRLLLASILLSIPLITPSYAQENIKPDDSVSYDLSSEDWVTTKTAHVVLDVEATVSATNAGAARADMIKAVNDAAKGDWRLTAFSRVPDQTGMERWSVNFDARLPEIALNGLTDAAKRASKAGMQITVSDIDFTPTLDETEAARDALRTHLYKQIGEQLASLNSALPGRGYRIAQINFDTAEIPAPFHPIRRSMMSSLAVTTPPSDTAAGPEHAQKIVLTAHVTYAALPTPPVAAH